MKARICLVLLLCACFGLAALSYDSPDEIADASSVHTVPFNEHLTYKIAWLGIPVGTGELKVKGKTTLRGREVYHVVGRIETNKVLRKIFPMNDTAESWIDAETFESVQFEKNIAERLINTHERMIFDGAPGKARFESLKTGEKQDFNVPEPVYDVVSVTYWVRRQPLVPGQLLKTTLTADRKIWELEARVSGREELKINGKKIDTIRVDPDTVVEGKERRGKASFYLSADSSRTPVKITYKAPFGKVTGTLTENKT